MSDQQVYEAFNHKIAEQTQKLDRIKEIQQSYLTEKNNMEKLVHNLSDFVLQAVTDSGILREFCLNPEDAPAIAENLKAYITATSLRHSSSEPDVALVLNNQVFRGIDHVADAIKSLKGTGHTDTVLLGDEEVQDEDGFTQTNSETIWECHGWKFVYEFIDNIPKMDKGYDYCFFFKLAEDKYTDGFAFPMLMISTMLTRTTGKDIVMGCSVERSPDGQNHFALACRKERK